MTSNKPSEWAMKVAVATLEGYGYELMSAGPYAVKDVARAIDAALAEGERREREACAMYIEQRNGSIPDRQEIAAAIRRRGE